MKQYQTDTQILNLIGQLKYATIRNLYSRRSNSWHASNLHIKSLLKQELIEPVPSNYRLFSIYREQFYRLSRKGARETGLKYKEYRLRASVRHESAKVDVALSFIYLYPDLITHIDYPANQHSLILTDKTKYNPDIIVYQHTSDYSKVYRNLVEIEISRDPDQVYNEKIVRKIQKLKKFKHYKNLNQNSLVLIFYRAPNTYDLLELPKNWHEQNIEQAERHFKSLRKIANKSPRFLRFLPLHHFTRLDQSLWHTPTGEKVQLINN